MSSIATNPSPLLTISELRIAFDQRGHTSEVLHGVDLTIASGESIGLVGATGWATGPHLHFEFRVNGRHQDPLQLARQSETIPVSAQARERFNAQAKEVAQQFSASAVAFANANP